MSFPWHTYEMPQNFGYLRLYACVFTWGLLIRSYDLQLCLPLIFRSACEAKFPLGCWGLQILILLMHLHLQFSLIWRAWPVLGFLLYNNEMCLVKEKTTMISRYWFLSQEFRIWLLSQEVRIFCFVNKKMGHSFFFLTFAWFRVGQNRQE